MSLLRENIAGKCVVVKGDPTWGEILYGKGMISETNSDHPPFRFVIITAQSENTTPEATKTTSISLDPIIVPIPVTMVSKPVITVTKARIPVNTLFRKLFMKLIYHYFYK